LLWQCSECGADLECARAPITCRECGTAGVIFVPTDVPDPIVGDPEAENLSAVWLRAGMERLHAMQA
jgi:hypothetical protein